MSISGSLAEYLNKYGISGSVTVPDGALINPVSFPIGAVETSGAILFADLPGFSRTAQKLSPIECAYYASHFFA